MSRRVCSAAKEATHLARRRRYQPEAQPQQWQDEGYEYEYEPVPPQDAYPPEEDFDDRVYTEEDYGRQEYAEDWGDYAEGYAEDDAEGYHDDYADVPEDGPEAYYLPEEEEKVHARTIFKPNTRKPAFMLSVAVNAVRIMILIVVLAGLAAVGAVAGIAKGYVETAPWIWRRWSPRPRRPLSMTLRAT